MEFAPEGAYRLLTRRLAGLALEDNRGRIPGRQAAQAECQKRNPQPDGDRKGETPKQVTEQGCCLFYDHAGPQLVGRRRVGRETLDGGLHGIEPE